MPKNPLNVIVIPDDDDEWPETGPQNPEAAKAYVEKINAVFTILGEHIHAGDKWALPKAIEELKKLAAKHWGKMEQVDVEAVIKSIHNPACVFTMAYLDDIIIFSRNEEEH